jgi:hypothetical protein
VGACRYEVVLLTSHGILHRVNKGEQIRSATLSPVEWSVKKQHPEGVTGLSFNAEHSVLACTTTIKELCIYRLLTT